MEYHDSVKNRLKRVEGQVRGVLSMMEQQKDCKDVVTQLTAIRTAVDRTIGVVIGANLASCVREQLEQGNDPDDVIQEAVNILVKSR
ncbi:metal-sensitive transcriptional regulator [Paenibacillus apiarius]|uniref:Metal-sensitive transcriptional regulator n=1 Tax=Paenibacillus apiarius TaxID=46240 RepID=A0ABT4DXI8_9BACL|nr:metal-sensitive transcriptional regulator [Paenibacillus apiarius]MBN3527521.1 metal-sensitive transcriptional regulator [Paenibacillus apiarius]MCY9515873.1 metal-sensitive transcriptional regulator [Paenibacillus apiarius]MCY9520783.1 metal-sensitive transcriptional regulator [Paenibacillus apiarius]MCY9553487.1 metal-sensitive transcriptional regulator [Paenibacillus apiarius]MCY9557989.1 metal-sensitive transcriptional regulator [Paenibacillus apiarius]